MGEPNTRPPHERSRGEIVLQPMAQEEIAAFEAKRKYYEELAARMADTPITVSGLVRVIMGMESHDRLDLVQRLLAVMDADDHIALLERCVVRSPEEALPRLKATLLERESRAS